MDEITSKRLQIFVVDAKGRKPLAWFGFKQYVRRGDQGTKAVAAGLVIKIDHHAALARVVMPPVEAAIVSGLIVDERGVAARRIAAGRFDQDDVGAHVSQELACERDRVSREFDDPHALQRSRPRAGVAAGVGHRTPSSRKVATSSAV